MSSTEPFRCPNCASDLSQLRGGGEDESFCPTCGFTIRQSNTRTLPGGRLHQGWFHFDSRSTTVQEVRRWRLRPLLLIALLPTLLFAVAIRKLFVGSTAFEALYFAELYVLLFCAIAFGIPTWIRTRRMDGRFIVVLIAGALAAGAMVARLAPTIGEKNYCGESEASSDIWRTPPHTFRCTSLPFFIGGAFGGYWLMYWLASAWETRRNAQ